MKLGSIQLLRALAALIVVVYHARSIEGLMIDAQGGGEAAFITGLWAKGFSGVDLFFVISGFIMVFVTGEARARPQTAVIFLFSRASRIYPLWWLFASLMAAYFWVTYGLPYDVERTLGSDMIEQTPILHLVFSYLLIPQPGWPVLGVGWTLVHEMYFYLGFTLLLLLPCRFRGWALGFWGTGVIAGSVAGLSAPFAGNYLQLVFYPMTLEFVMGGFAALLVVNGRVFSPALVTVAGTVLFIAAMIWHPDPEQHPQNQLMSTLQWGRVIWFGIPSAILVYGLASLDIRGRFRAPGFMVSIGDWSYALYLSHMLTLSALKRIFPVAADIAENRFGLPAGSADLLRVGTPGLADNVIFLATALVASLIVAWISYRYFEQPALRLFGRLRAQLFDSRRLRLHPAPIRGAVW